MAAAIRAAALAAAVDDDAYEGDEIPTVKFVALDEAEIIIEHSSSRRLAVAPGATVARTLGPLPGLAPDVEAPPPRILPLASAPAAAPLPPRVASGSSPPPFVASPAGATATAATAATATATVPGVTPAAGPAVVIPALPAQARVLPPPPRSVGAATEPVRALGELRPRRHLLLPLVVGAVLAMVVVAVLVNVIGGGPAEVAPAAVAPTSTRPPVAEVAPAAPPAPPPAAPPAAPTPARVTVHVTSEPDDATVILDGERLGRTPLTVEVPRRPGPVWLKLRKRGYKPRKLEVDLGADVRWDLTLPRAD